MKNCFIGILFVVMLLGACEKNAPADNISASETAAADNEAAAKEEVLDVTPTSFVDAIDYLINSEKFDQKQIEKVLVATPGITQSMSSSELEVSIGGEDDKKAYPAILQVYYYQANHDLVMNTNIVRTDNGAIRTSLAYPNNDCHPILEALKEKYIKDNTKKPDNMLNNAEAYEQPYDGWTFKLAVGKGSMK